MSLVVFSQDRKRCHLDLNIIYKPVNERKRKPDQHFERTVPNNSLHVPNNHLDIPTTKSSRWQFTAQRRKMYRDNLHLHTSNSYQRLQTLRLYLSIFTLVLHIPLYTIFDMSGQERKTGLRLGDMLRCRDVTKSEILTKNLNDMTPQEFIAGKQSEVSTQI